MRHSENNINYKLYFILCWCVPRIMSVLPFSSGFHYMSVLFLIDSAIDIITIIIGFAYLFRIDTYNQLFAIKYYICNYPAIYLICYIIIKPITFFYIIIIYLINSKIPGYKDYIIITYINSNFIYYSELVTNTILHIFVFYIIYKRYYNFKNAPPPLGNCQRNQIQALEIRKIK
jgi:hypothetical protein